MQDIKPVLDACLLNAERLIESANLAMGPGRYNVAYHLAALAMEEIGKCTLILTSARDPDSSVHEEEEGSEKWMEDHGSQWYQTRISLHGLRKK